MPHTMDDSFQGLLQYAAKLGVQLNGIMPRRLPGRGYGMVATRDVQPAETVLAISTRALRTLATVPKTMSRKLDHDVSVHGILAADLVLSLHDSSSDYAPWDAVLPTPTDLEGMPMLWPTQLQDLLPSAARTALARQQAKLQRDWAATKAWAEDDESIDGKEGKEGKGKPRLAYEQYLHGWLLVNSRTFYYTTPRSEKTTSSKDDRMAMQPVADLFNHAADHGCDAAYAAQGFSFVADRLYEEGDEVPISYGAHANDALLVEYGFILSGATNKWDEVALDAAVLPRLTAAQKDDLDEVGFLGKYMIDAQTPGGCYRTQIALRRILCGASAARVAAWRAFVDGLPDASGGRLEATQEQLDALLLELLDEMADLAQETLSTIETLSLKRSAVGTHGMRDVLTRRWHQIESMVAQSAKQLRKDAAEREEEEAKQNTMSADS